MALDIGEKYLFQIENHRLHVTCIQYHNPCEDSKAYCNNKFQLQLKISSKVRECLILHFHRIQLDILVQCVTSSMKVTTYMCLPKDGVFTGPPTYITMKKLYVLCSMCRTIFKKRSIFRRIQPSHACFSRESSVVERITISFFC